MVIGSGWGRQSSIFESSTNIANCCDSECETSTDPAFSTERKCLATQLMCDALSETGSLMDPADHSCITLGLRLATVSILYIPAHCRACQTIPCRGLIAFRGRPRYCSHTLLPWRCQWTACFAAKGSCHYPHPILHQACWRVPLYWILAVRQLLSWWKWESAETQADSQKKHPGSSPTSR